MSRARNVGVGLDSDTDSDCDGKWREGVISGRKVRTTDEHGCTKIKDGMHSGRFTASAQEGFAERIACVRECAWCAAPPCLTDTAPMNYFMYQGTPSRKRR